MLCHSYLGLSLLPSNAGVIKKTLPNNKWEKPNKVEGAKNISLTDE